MMNALRPIAISLILASKSMHCFSDAIKPTHSMNYKKEKIMNGAAMYKENFGLFSYYIETIGTVAIENVDLNEGMLTALYSYRQGGETRQVVSALSLDKDGIYKGTCTTKVNGKVLLAVNTWLTFKLDGTASGNWSWSGEPTHKDPIVTISREN